MATWTSSGSRSVTSVQSTTEATAPTANEGVNLDAVSGFNIYVEADEGQTLTGSGDLLGYLKSGIRGRWARGDAQLDLAIPAEANGHRTYVFSGFTVPSPRGRLAHLCDGVGVSGGGVTITYECTGGFHSL
jgi:hypothetical protein